MKCQDCVSVCPNDALYYGRGPIALGAKPRVARPEPRLYSLALWEEVLLGVAFAAAFFTFRGLYGAVPFLMALGLAGILAYLVLLAARLLVRPHLATHRFPFKRAGRLLPAGWAFVAAMVLLFAFWGHSAFVHGNAALGERAFRATAELRRAFLDPAAPPPTLTAGDRETVRRARERLEAADRWGLFPTAGAAHRLAWTAALFGYSSDLGRFAAEALERGEAPGEVHQLLARDARRRGDHRAAAAAAERAVAAAPDAVAPLVALGVIRAEAGDLPGARAAFDRGRERFPDSPDLAYNAGLVRALAGDAPGAVALFERALTLAPEHREARENLAGVLAGVGRFAESVEHYRRALAQAPEDAETRLLLARALGGAGRLAEAEVELAHALRLAPDLPHAAAVREELEARRAAAGAGSPP
jgi:Flp pilus assembly protein TadD